jgi:hypothetical protein
MKIGKIALILIAGALSAAAQDKITVPLTNPSQPVTLKITQMNGSIKVTAGTGRDVVVTSADNRSSRRERDRDQAPPGMTRIGGRPGLDIEEDHNVVQITSGMNGESEIVVETPANTNLQLKSINGAAIEVTGVNGDHEIQNNNGSIKLTDVSGSVVANSLNGSVTVSLNRVTGNKPMSFTSLNGKIDVTLPADTKARLKLKSDNGSIFSDFEVKLDSSGGSTIEDSRGKDGKYRISVDRTVSGTINGGGPDFTFRTMNGNILIHKK